MLIVYVFNVKSEVNDINLGAVAVAGLVEPDADSQVAAAATSRDNGCRVCGCAQSVGFGVWGLGFGVWGLGIHVEGVHSVWCFISSLLQLPGTISHGVTAPSSDVIGTLKIVTFGR